MKKLSLVGACLALVVTAVQALTDAGAIVDAMSDASRYKTCPELRGARYYLEKVKAFCLGCRESPYATEDWIETEQKDALQRLEDAERRCATGQHG